jgi:hypothetical protein
MGRNLQTSGAAALAGLILITGCSGGSGEEDEVEDLDEDASGIWTATVTPDGQAAVNATLVVIPDGDFALASSEALLIGSGATNGSAFSATSTGFAPPGGTFANGAISASFSLTGTVTTEDALSGSYSGANESGRIAATYNSAVTERQASLAISGGSYLVPQQPGAPIVSLAINNGAMTFNVSTGCVGNGNIAVVNPTRNYYTWTMTFSNCQAINGDYSGLSFMPTNTSIALMGSSPGNQIPFSLLVVK